MYEYTLSKAYSSNESSPIVKDNSRQMNADNCVVQSFAAGESNKSSSRRAKYLQAATTQADAKQERNGNNHFERQVANGSVGQESSSMLTSMLQMTGSMSEIPHLVHNSFPTQSSLDNRAGYVFNLHETGDPI